MLHLHGSDHHLANELFGGQIQSVGNLLLSKLLELRVDVQVPPPATTLLDSLNMQLTLEQQAALNIIMEEVDNKRRYISCRNKLVELVLELDS